MTAIHNYKGDLKRTVERIEESQMSSTKKKQLVEFKNYLLSEGIGYAKIIRYLGDLTKYARMLGKPFEAANEQDVRRVVAEINQTTLSPYTKRGFKIALRRFQCFLRGITQKGKYPVEVEWMSMSIPNSQKRLPDELLSEQDIKSMISHAENLRDKTFIATLTESGGRVSEIGTMRIKHVSFEGHGARLTIHGKTGARRILVVSSAPYLLEWVNQHPNNSDRDAYLWHNPRGTLLSYAALSAIFKKAAKRAGIKKRVYCHLARHSQATRMAAVMSEQTMKPYFGWTQGSNMAGVYVHMSGKDADDAILKANGIKINHEVKESQMKPQKCSKCKATNEATNTHCKRCGMILDEDKQRELVARDVDRRQMDEVMSRLLKDKEVLELIGRKLRNAAA